VRVRPLLAAALAASACGRGKTGERPLERDIRTGLAAQLATAVEGVECPAPPAPFTCRARVGDTWLHVEVIPSAGGELAWQLTDFAIAAAPLEAYLVAELAGLGVPATADCGARVRVAQVGDRIACALGSAGAAWATITDEDGGFSIEIALGDDAVHARTEASDVAALDELSAALDHDGTVDEATVFGDAGVDGAAP